ncbi:hypothetical protein [Saccharothrix coeruleofusca]|uniref:Secreted protein n=1 Tax=Saccharothrix coeruleofusca TaxID=33919 RepID=A0A918APJ5_9PSEU|nr:hypothetical protein [Saccharothrix coeruleofusca]MBP2337283.1 hypothetical protein [Saccharothrix coeruleofusca]GGP65943.1 hypothetical protein GCM10010185_43160 [Saccharothrix coeruleofusca]
MAARRFATAIGMVIALFTAAALAAPVASASTVVSSGSSAKGGYGVAGFTDGAHLYACDEGKPDGMRAMAFLWVSGHTKAVVAQDFNGSNAECSDPYLVVDWIEVGTSYRLEACIQDGASGTPQKCRSKYGVF